ncbi:MAG: hypothetical protein HY014_14570 [Acidobacteria bacterium]|nr:hypothetical protein [Acidobacteriota bacterium]MBI3489384.1 hypothetical protein [Acidobacteriota bacterium]
MNRTTLVLGLVTCAPLLSGDLDRTFQFDLHRVGPTFEGHFNGVQNGKPLRVDLQNDFGLQKDSTKLGLSLEYQGPRFAVEFSGEEQDYRGHNFIQKDVQLNGSTFHAGALVDSDVKLRNYTFNWTIRAFARPQFWIGIDLGARVWDLRMTASAYEPLTTAYVPPVTEKVPLPIPQIGLSTGFNAFDKRIVAKGYYHLLSAKGATYHHAGADLRYFPVRWLGVRVFTDTEKLDVPNGSVKDDLEIRLDRQGTGFGVVLRF